MRSFWSYADAFPPILVRLLAREKWRSPLSSTQIAERSHLPDGSGLMSSQVESISWNTTWAGVDFQTMRAFLIGCGVDFCNPAQMKRIAAYMRSNPTFKYLRDSKDWGTRYQPMIVKWHQHANPARH